MTFRDDPFLEYDEIESFFDRIIHGNAPHEKRQAAQRARDEMVDRCSRHELADDRLVLCTTGGPALYESAEKKRHVCQQLLRRRYLDIRRNLRRTKGPLLDIDDVVEFATLTIGASETSGTVWPCLTSTIEVLTENATDARVPTVAGRELPTLRRLLLRFVERIASGDQTAVYETRGGQRLGRRDAPPPLALLPTYRELVEERAAIELSDELARRRLDNNYTQQIERKYRPRVDEVWQGALLHCG